MSEKVTVKVERNILHLPAIALRGLVVFPNNLLHFDCLLYTSDAADD